MSGEFHSHNTQVSIHKMHHACFKHSQEGIRPHTVLQRALFTQYRIVEVYPREAPNPLNPVPRHPHASWLAPSFFPGFCYRVSLRTQKVCPQLGWPGGI